MNDLRLAWRALRATPIVSAVAVLSLALGIGANTAIFSLVNSLLLRSLPVADPQRLVAIGYPAGTHWADGWTFETWTAIRAHAQDFAGAFATGETTARLGQGDQGQRMDVLLASGGFFSTLGLQPVIGRFFTDADDVRGGGPHGPVAVISYGLWQQRFDGDPAVIGTPVTLDDASYTIAGVMPTRFFGVEVGRRFDVVLPLETEPLLHPRNPMIGSPLLPMWLHVILRLRPGDSIAQATAAIRARQPAIREEGTPPAMMRFPDMRRDFLKTPFELTMAATGTSYLRHEYTRPLLALFVIVALVLLIACANIANLQLARATSRRHEMSVRRALGASRWRLARQLLIESLVVAAIGAGGGLLIAHWASRALVVQLRSVAERVDLDLSLDWRVLAFTGAVTVLTALIFGTAPAWRTSRVEPMEALKEHGRLTTGGSRASVSGGLVIAQVALSLVLLVVSGLFIGTFERLVHVASGFDVDRLLVFNVSKGPVDAGDRPAFYQRLVDAAAAAPGVSHAAGSLMGPFGMAGAAIQVKMPGGSSSSAAGGEPPNPSLYFTTPNWFATYGVTLREGRDLSDRDTQRSPFVMVVNEAFVRHFLPGGRALDQHVGLSLAGHDIGPRTIVGVVADTIERSMRARPEPTVYLPLAQWDIPIPMLPQLYVTVRAPAGVAPAMLTREVSAALEGVDPNLGLMAHPLAQDVRQSFARERLLATLSGCFGGLALLLATIGLYGVTAYAVSRRRMEIGIRLALGSTPAGVVRLVLSRVAWLVAAGVAAGAAVSAWIGQFATPLLFGVTPTDPATLAIAALTLALVGGLAGAVPASRASRLDPARVLRAQ